ncbi:hypothetical protein ACHAQJ_008116 [Trichoderma viride]
MGRGDGGGPRGQKRKRTQVKQAQVQRSSLGSTWVALPAELREMILEFLEVSLQGGKAASYASVCREWYAYFEPYAFQRLQLSLTRLHEFETFITEHRRPFVRRIWFRFERSIQPGETSVRIRHGLDHYRFYTAIFHLFQILSEWTEQEEGRPGIVLELTAFSAADPDYSMKDTVPEELKDVDLTMDSEALNAVYDKPPSYLRRLTEEDKQQQANIRDCYVPQYAYSPRTRFPKVKLITNLTVRRQMHSGFFWAYMTHMVEALPKLEFLTYEPRLLPFALQYMEGYDTNFGTVLGIVTAMPSSIRRLQVFEDNIALYDRGRRHRGPDNLISLSRLEGYLRDKEPELLALSFIIDARDFFADYWTPQITRPQHKLEWTNLTSLLLTSSLIKPRSWKKVPPLLLAAARAARYMPNLDIMELYYAAARQAGIFTYVHDKEGSIIYWESTWKWEFPPEVLTEWKRAAAVHGTRVLNCIANQIGSGDLKWPGSIISLLRTRVTAVHALTYGNMMNGLNSI